MVRIAVATADGKVFYNGHFGDAPEYIIFELSSDGYVKSGRIKNTSPEERSHGDPEKARGVQKMMKSRNIEALMNRQFGPNIVRIKKAFLPIVPDTDSIEKAMDLALQHYKGISEALARGPPFEIYFLRE